MHDDGTVTEYVGHMYQRDVVVGQHVQAGQRIALMGSEGEATGPHPHLRVRIGTSTTGPRDRPGAVSARPRGEPALHVPGGGGGQGHHRRDRSGAGQRPLLRGHFVRRRQHGVPQRATRRTAGRRASSCTARGCRNDKWIELAVERGRCRLRQRDLPARRRTRATSAASAADRSVRAPAPDSPPHSAAGHPLPPKGTPNCSSLAASSRRRALSAAAIALAAVGRERHLGGRRRDTFKNQSD
ncbi:M23 family metallopeptidase [Streptomyces sp. L7]